MYSFNKGLLNLSCFPVTVADTRDTMYHRFISVRCDDFLLDQILLRFFLPSSQLGPDLGLLCLSLHSLVIARILLSQFKEFPPILDI